MRAVVGVDVILVSGVLVPRVRDAFEIADYWKFAYTSG